MSNINSIDYVAVPPCLDTDSKSLHSYFDDSARALSQLPYPEIEKAGDLLYRAYLEERRVFLFGNGGSAALASHFACDLGKGTVTQASSKKKRQRIFPECAAGASGGKRSRLHQYRTDGIQGRKDERALRCVHCHPF